MFYDNEFVDTLEKSLKIPAGIPYLYQMAKTIGDMLETNKMIYKSFGVYWWAMKEALQAYCPNRNAWFMGTYTDHLMKERARHGSLFRSVLAAVYYHSQQDTYTSDHYWEDSDGIEHDYTLFDEDAGC